MSKLICTMWAEDTLTRLLLIREYLYYGSNIRETISKKSNKRNIFFALRRLRPLIFFFLFFSFSNLKNSANKKNKNNIYVIGHSCVQQCTNYHDHEGLLLSFFFLLALVLSYTRTRACISTYILRSERIRPCHRQLTVSTVLLNARDAYP
jgi:hypothetical protein